MRTYRDLHPTFPDRSTWTLPWILRERARTHGGRVYLDVPDTSLRLTFTETLTRAEAVASGLLAAGGEPGDRVFIMAPNCGEFILAWFGAACAGLVEVPINSAYTGTFLEHQIATVAPRFGIIDAALAERFLDGAAAWSALERFYVLGKGTERDAAIAALTRAGWAAAPFSELLATPRGDLPAVSPRDLGSIFFTSGTTGLSKGVMMPHAQMTFFADECVSLTRLSDADAYMSVGPLFHGNAQFLAAFPALIAGARFVLQERFSASRWAQQVRDSEATVTNFVGVMMDFTFKQPPRDDDADNALRCIFAAPTASSIVEAFRRRFGVEAFVEVFGLTETCMPILSPYGEDRPTGACGLAAEEWFDIRLVDPETDEEVPVGAIGELTVRPKLPGCVCAGYYGMPDRSLEAMRNLWFHTGDALRRDHDGWYYFVDRFKDAIRRRGENISSYEVEQAILGHEQVLECAAVAVPAQTEAGEDEVALFVVPVAEAAIDAGDVRAWAAERLPRFAQPEHVVLIDALPKTPSGKVRKGELREQLPALDLAGG